MKENRTQLHSANTNSIQPYCRADDDLGQQRFRRHQAVEACTINQSLLDSQRLRRDIDLQEKESQRIQLMERSANLARETAQAQDARRAGIARINAELGAQLTSKEMRIAMEEFSAREALAKAKQNEEERQRRVADAIRSLTM